MTWYVSSRSGMAYLHNGLVHHFRNIVNREPRLTVKSLFFNAEQLLAQFQHLLASGICFNVHYHQVAFSILREKDRLASCFAQFRNFVIVLTNRGTRLDIHSATSDSNILIIL